MTPGQLRRLRKSLGLTQSRFAALLGIHKITVAKWEAGTLGMSATTRRLLRLLVEQGIKGTTRPVGKRARRRSS